MTPIYVRAITFVVQLSDDGSYVATCPQHEYGKYIAHGDFPNDALAELLRVVASDIESEGPGDEW